MAKNSSFTPSALIRFFRLSAVALWFCASGARADFYNEAGRSVVRLTVEGTLKVADSKGSVDYYDVGTGFLVSPDGLILTAGHLFPPLNRFKDGQMWIHIALTEQKNRRMVATTPPRAARLLRLSPYPSDVAILKIEPDDKPFPYLRLCDDYDASTRTIMLGYGAGDTYIRKLEGTVEAPDNGVEPADLQLPTSPGDSGAPVFNETGAVFALIIGNPIVNGISVSGSAAAVTMPVTMNKLSPETSILSGLSYFPKCDEKPSPLSKTVYYPISENVPAPSERTINISPPVGYEFTGKIDVSDIRGTNIGSKVVVPKNQTSNSIDVSIFAAPIQKPNDLGAGGNFTGRKQSTPLPAEVFGNIAAEVQRKVPLPTAISDSPGEEVSGLTLELRKEEAKVPGGPTVYSVTSKPPHGMQFDELLKIEFISQTVGGKQRHLDDNVSPTITSRGVKPDLLFLAASLTTPKASEVPEGFKAVATLHLSPTKPDPLKP